MGHHLVGWGQVGCWEGHTHQEAPFVLTKSDRWPRILVNTFWRPNPRQKHWFQVWVLVITSTMAIVESLCHGSMVWYSSQQNDDGRYNYGRWYHGCHDIMALGIFSWPSQWIDHSRTGHFKWQRPQCMDLGCKILLQLFCTQIKALSGSRYQWWILQCISSIRLTQNKSIKAPIFGWLTWETYPYWGLGGRKRTPCSPWRRSSILGKISEHLGTSDETVKKATCDLLNRTPNNRSYLLIDSPCSGFPTRKKDYEYLLFSRSRTVSDFQILNERNTSAENHLIGSNTEFERLEGTNWHAKPCFGNIIAMCFPLWLWYAVLSTSSEYTRKPQSKPRVHAGCLFGEGQPPQLAPSKNMLFSSSPWRIRPKSRFYWVSDPKITAAISATARHKQLHPSSSEALVQKPWPTARVWSSGASKNWRSYSYYLVISIVVDIESSKQLCFAMIEVVRSLLYLLLLVSPHLLG